MTLNDFFKFKNRWLSIISILLMPDTKDSDVEAESVKMVPGGSALNQGRHLHALGMAVHFVGAVDDLELLRSSLD